MMETPANVQTLTSLDGYRLQRAKGSYTTRRVPQEDMALLIGEEASTVPGDLVLARVEKVGDIDQLESETGRLVRLSAGDEILLCCADAHARDRIEAVVPDGRCVLAAPCGIAARSTDGSRRATEPTYIKLLGLLANGGRRVLNLKDYALPQLRTGAPRQPVLVLAGVGGETVRQQTRTNLIKGLVDSGYRVGTAKITGTPSGADVWAALDAGADAVMDFTDAGLVSTDRVSKVQLERVALSLLAYLSNTETDIIVLEVGGGLWHGENAELLQCGRFTTFIDGVMLAAGDAAGVASDVQRLNQWQLNVLGISATASQVPPAVRGLDADHTVPVIDTHHLINPAAVAALVNPLILTRTRNCAILADSQVAI